MAATGVSLGIGQPTLWPRRVVPSPELRAIVEFRSIKLLVDAGAVVICAGGGGVPVVDGAAGLEGVEAVIDKDLTAALLAEQTGARRLVMLTDVPYVERLGDAGRGGDRIRDRG